MKLPSPKKSESDLRQLFLRGYWEEDQPVHITWQAHEPERDGVSVVTIQTSWRENAGNDCWPELTSQSIDMSMAHAKTLHEWLGFVLGLSE